MKLKIKNNYDTEILKENKNFRNNQHYIIDEKIIHRKLDQKEYGIDEYENNYFKRYYGLSWKAFLIFCITLYFFLASDFEGTISNVIFIIYVFGFLGVFLYLVIKLFFMHSHFFHRRLKKYTLFKVSPNENEFIVHNKKGSGNKIIF